MVKADMIQNVVGLLPGLNNLLMELLHSLAPADWDKKTVARHWTVKDVAAHLLDGNIRVLSMLRDGYYGESFNPANERLLDFLNRLNADWVKAMKRVSPSMLILLHQATADMYSSYYAALDPTGISPFAVNWAGEEQSTNQLHIAREYTEKWLHQQQIRDAVGNDGIMNRTYFYPFIDVFMLALPYTYRDVKAEEGTVVKITIPGNIGGFWNLIRSENKWRLDKTDTSIPSSELIIDPAIAWKLFSKSIRPEDVVGQIQISGNRHLAEVALSMVSVMA